MNTETIFNRLSPKINPDSSRNDNHNINPNSKNKKLLIILASSLLIVVVLLSWYYLFHVRNQISNNIVIEVNNEKVYESDFMNYYDFYKSNIFQSSYPVNSSKNNLTVNDVLVDMIKTIIQLQKAKSYGLELTQEDVNEAKKLAAYGQPSTLSVTQTEKFYQNQVLIGKLREKIINEKNNSIPKEEITNYYNNNKNHFIDFPKYNINQIFLFSVDSNGHPFTQSQLQEIETKANNLFNRIQNGESFEELAKQFSEDKNTKDKGGNTGLLAIHEFNIRISELLPNMKEGELKMVKTSSGYYIFKLIGKTEYRIKPFEEVKEEIATALYESKPGSSYQDIVNQWIKESKIERHNDIVYLIEERIKNTK